MADEYATENNDSIRDRLAKVDGHGAFYISIHRETLRRLLADSEALADAKKRIAGLERLRDTYLTRASAAEDALRDHGLYLPEFEGEQAPVAVPHEGGVS